MGVHVMAEGAVVSRGPVPCIQSLSKALGVTVEGESGMLMTIVVDQFTSRRL
jgi:hypothetical protein